MISMTATALTAMIRPMRSVPITSTMPAAIARYCTCIPLSVPSIEQMTKTATYAPATYISGAANEPKRCHKGIVLRNRATTRLITASDHSFGSRKS